MNTNTNILCERLKTFWFNTIYSNVDTLHCVIDDCKNYKIVPRIHKWWSPFWFETHCYVCNEHCVAIDKH